jgi:hypothetical protein
MRISILDEPELEFASAGRHIDPRFGIVDYGPADAGVPTAPSDIRIGVVGTARDIDGVRGWFERCRSEIARKPSHQPHLFPAFPGFNQDAAFRSTLVFDDRLDRTISQRDIEIATSAPTRQAVERTVDLYRREIDALADERRCDVVVCARPDELHDEDVGDGETSENESRLDFHDLLKAHAMPLKMPFQVIRRRTWDRKGGTVTSKRGGFRQGVQDEATRAWNLHAALYYKAGGVPWRMARDTSDLASCYVGVSFYRSLSGASLQTSMAQVFNERGDGVIVRGGQAVISKEDRQPHLSEPDSFALLERALLLYKEEHHNLPARLVVHKSSRYTDEELGGFRAAANEAGLHTLELLWIPSKESTRLFRSADNPPLRGTMLSLDQTRHVLYTRGSVDFYAAYPGMYVPHPLGLRLIDVEQSPESLANEVLALTKMNWNDTQLDGREPITLRTADQVGSVLRYVEEGIQIAARYSYYM